MHLVEEGAERSLELSEVILVDRRVHPDNRQVLIVEGVTPRDVDFIAERRALCRSFKREAERHVGERISEPVRHGSTGVFRVERRDGGFGGVARGGDAEDSREWDHQDINESGASLHLLNRKQGDNAVVHDFWRGKHRRCARNCFLVVKDRIRMRYGKVDKQ